MRTIWLVEHGKAHLMNGSWHEVRQGSAPTWCGLTLSSGASEADYQPRCRNCVDTVNRYVGEATTALPDLVVETVVVTVTRPSDSQENVADYLCRTLSRKKAWKNVTVSLQEIAGVEA